MTVASSLGTVTYTGNGSTTVWAYSFYVGSTDELTVTLIETATGAETVLLTTQYTFTPDADLVGGSVTYPKAGGTPISSAYQLEIKRTTPKTQGVSLTNQGAFNPSLLEGALDKLTRITQELAASQSALEASTPQIAALYAVIADLQTVAGIAPEVESVAGIADILELAGYIDGGRADSLYTSDSTFDGGGASG